MNHTTTDFATGRKKDLDLVTARPSGDIPDRALTFRQLVDRYGIMLSDLELANLHLLRDQQLLARRLPDA